MRGWEREEKGKEKESIGKERTVLRKIEGLRIGRGREDEKRTEERRG